jgi:AcrR family transcriptional regulator
VTHSAIVGREARRRETSRRIVRRAAELTRDRGLDGWTMDDLAEAADVSRRTLFNYFPNKIDAIIGPVPEFPAEAIETFRAGGPHGRLMDDTRVLAHAILDDKQHDLERGTEQLRREILIANPRLLVTVHERFEELNVALVEHILVREGRDFGAERARLFIRLLIALFDACLHAISTELPPDAPTDARPRPLTEVFDEALDDARLLIV